MKIRLTRRPHCAWTGARGWVTDFIAAQSHGTAWAGSQGYLCGPPPMIDAGIDKLVELGVPLQHIHYDKFTDGAAPPVRPADAGHGAPTPSTTTA